MMRDLLDIMFATAVIFCGLILLILYLVGSVL